MICQSPSNKRRRAAAKRPRLEQAALSYSLSGTGKPLGQHGMRSAMVFLPCHGRCVSCRGNAGCSLPAAPSQRQPYCHWTVMSPSANGWMWNFCRRYLSAARGKLVSESMRSQSQLSDPEIVRKRGKRENRTLLDRSVRTGAWVLSRLWGGWRGAVAAGSWTSWVLAATCCRASWALAVAGCWADVMAAVRYASIV
jgi:hypothetical protein